MSASVTFGSVGDIITLCIIIKDLVKALDDSKGSSAQYQEVIRELWALDRVLLEVELLWRTCESTNELNALRETAHRMADQCRRSIEAFLKKVEKYRPSLRDGGSGSVLRDATMKIRWQVSHADELTKFRAEINAHCSAINMLLLTASVNLHKLGDQRLHARLALGEQRMESASKEQELLLKDVKDKLEESNKQIRAGNAVTLKIAEALRLDWIRQLGNDLKTFMRKIVVMNIATYKAIMDIRRCLPSHLERSLYQEPFILEDAIGRIAPVHMQFISSWQAFDSVLELRFQNMQGYKMVQQKEYVIQESATRREIDRSNAWEASFLPGQKVVMSMLFKDSASSTSSCPRCQMSSDQPQNSDVQCVGCGMWYRRITEYNDVEPPPPVSQISLRKPREEVIVFGETSFSKIIFGPELPDHLSPSKKRKREDVENADITLFKRVRVLSKKTRVRRIKQISGPFTGLATARNGFHQVSTRPTYDHIILKSSASISNQPSENPLEKEHVGRSMADSTPAIFLDTVVVPRTDYIPSVDDSDDGADDSDSIEDDSDDDETSPPILVRQDHPCESVGSLQSSGSKEPNAPLSQALKDKPRESPPPLQPVLGTDYTPPVDSSEDTWDAAEDDGVDCADDSTSLFLRARRQRRLLKAISRGSQDQVLQLMDSGIDIEYIDGTTALCHTVQNGNETIVDILLARGANVNNIDYANSTALMRAAGSGKAALVPVLLSHKADLEMKDVYGDTALQMAATKGNFLIVKMLLAHGASMSTNALAGKTELQLATAKGHTRLVRFLLERGADILVKDSRGSTLLHMAAAGVHDAVILLLLQNGADVEVKDNLAQTPLMWYEDQISRTGSTSQRHREPVTPCQKELAARKWYYRSVGTKAPDSATCLNKEQGRDETSFDRPS